MSRQPGGVSFSIVESTRCCLRPVLVSSCFRACAPLPYQGSRHTVGQHCAGLLPVTSPTAQPATSPLLAAVLNKAGWAKIDTSLSKDKTAAVLAELRRPGGSEKTTSSAGVSADHPVEQTSGISAFSQIPVSELSVCFCLFSTSLQLEIMLTPSNQGGA